MNESEKRRKRLLEEARSIYSDKRMPPAIHPRYHSFYSSLYGKQTYPDTLPKSTFNIRLFLSILLFALFVAADYRETKIANVDSDRVVSEIQYQINVKNVWDQL